MAHSDGIGKGSRFVVRLPLLRGASTEAPQPRVQGRGSPPKTTSLRVLVVDDNRDAADSLGRMLTHLGWRTRVVYDGPAALEALESYRPNVMLLDLGMPAMDGFEVVRRLRERPDWENLTVVALSGWGQDEDRRKTAAAGFHYHLLKPAAVQQLEALLQSIEAKSCAAQSAVADAEA